MPTFASRGSQALLLALLLGLSSAHAEEPPEHLAPGFTARTAGSRLVVLPADLELFSMSAGGVIEPRDDWTRAAQKNFVSALGTQGKRLGAKVTVLDATEGDEFADLMNLHRAVAEAISMHHRSGLMELPTKGKALDWSLGDAVRPLKERTGADYALFTWMRDSYASGERKAAMLALAAIGALSLGGEQEGYASLVDLNTGRVLWFNRIDRMSGDLREPAPAVETVETLLKDFPATE